MKKTVLALAALLTMNVTAGFAAPINDLSQGQTAVGAGSDGFYIEHKLTNNFTLGFQNVDLDGVDADDIYGQFDLNKNLKGIIGSRNFDPSSKTYFGLAATGPVSPEMGGYASFVVSSDFKEMQIGGNYALTNNVDLNIKYKSFMPDYGNNRNDVGIGATLKF